ncbi:hypothetical protein CDV36_016623, partial [Fusarium kuroshium]
YGLHRPSIDVTAKAQDLIRATSPKIEWPKDAMPSSSRPSDGHLESHVGSMCYVRCLYISPKH